MPQGKHQMPSTLKRSPPKAQRTFEETLEHAEQEYGKGERASRTAYASLKHGFEKVGDHWEPKEHKGPSDPRSEKTGAARRRGEGATYGGVDAHRQYPSRTVRARQEARRARPVAHEQGRARAGDRQEAEVAERGVGALA